MPEDTGATKSMPEDLPAGFMSVEQLSNELLGDNAAFKARVAKLLQDPELGPAVRSTLREFAQRRASIRTDPDKQLELLKHTTSSLITSLQVEQAVAIANNRKLLNLNSLLADQLARYAIAVLDALHRHDYSSYVIGQTRACIEPHYGAASVEFEIARDGGFTVRLNVLRPDSYIAVTDLRSGRMAIRGFGFASASPGKELDQALRQIGRIAD